MFDSGFRSRLGLVLVLLVASSCDRSRRVFVPRASEPAARVVRVGLFASLTGADAAMGSELRRGFVSAIDEWNASEEARALRVELVAYDDQSRSSAAAVAVERLVREDHAVIVAAASNEERASTAAGLCPAALVVCPASAAGSDARIIGLLPSVSDRAEMLADLVVRTMQMTRAAVLLRRGAASDQLAAEAFRAALKTRGVTAVELLEFAPETILDVLAKLANDAPQAVLVAMDGPEAALVGRAMRRRAVPSALLFFGSPSFTVLPEADRIAALEGALFPTVFVLARPDANTQRFIEAMQARFATPPSEHAFLGYSAGRYVLDALSSRDALDPSALKTALLDARAISPLAVVRVERGVPTPLLPVPE